MKASQSDFKVCKVGKKAKEVRDFCLQQIKLEYGYEYVPEWHADLDSLLGESGMYSTSNRGLFLVARREMRIIGTIGMRDLKYKPALLEKFSNKLGTGNIASIWRTYTDKDFRGIGVASKLLKMVEEEANEQSYDYIYLHTSWNKPASVKFWQNRGYQIIEEEDTGDKTVHMVKSVK